MSALDKLLSRAGRRSLNKAIAGLKTPVSQLSNKQKATAALSGLAAGAAIGKGVGQPLLETLMHSNPEGLLSKAQQAAQRSELLSGAQAAGLSRAKEYLAEALASAEKYNPSAVIDSTTSSVINSAQQEAAETVSKYLNQQAGEKLFPRAAELSGILAQARAAEVLQDAGKAIPFAGAGADLSEVARNLTILNNLSNPEVVSKITESYSPMVDSILTKARGVSDEAIRSNFSPLYTAAKTKGKYIDLLAKIKNSPARTVKEIRPLLSQIHNPEAQVSRLVNSHMAEIRPRVLDIAIGKGTDMADRGLSLADRSLSPAIELLRNNSPGIPVPTGLTLDGTTALSATGDAIKGALVTPALEVLGKTTAKALGKEVPLLGQFLGIGDAVSSMGRNAIFDKYISGALEGPGGNYLVDKTYYTPQVGKLYRTLMQDSGAVEKLYNRSLDPKAISKMTQDVVSKI